MFLGGFGSFSQGVHSCPHVVDVILLAQMSVALVAWCRQSGIHVEQLLLVRGVQRIVVSQSLTGASPNTSTVSASPFITSFMSFDEDDDWDMDAAVQDEIGYCEMMALEQEAAEYQGDRPEETAQDFAVQFGMDNQEPECDPEPEAAQAVDQAETNADAESHPSVLPVAEVDIDEAVAETSSMASSPGPRVEKNSDPKRYRLRGKTGQSEQQKESAKVQLLTQRCHHLRFPNLDHKRQTKARNFVRNYVFYRMKRVQNGHPVKLKTGGKLHCRTKEEYDNNQDSLRKHLLFDFAMNDENEPDNIGAAATKWLEEAGFRTHLPKGRPSPNNFEGMIKSTQVMLTWHGDFGASNVDTSSKQSMGLDDLVDHLKTLPAIKNAWDEIKNTLLSLVDRFRLVAYAFVLEVCPKTWQQEHKLRLHVHAWLLQGYRRERLTMADLVLRGASSPYMSIYGQEARKGMAANAGCFYVQCEKKDRCLSHQIRNHMWTSR